MSVHIHQTRHNEKFHASLCENFADEFFDWKITCLFYISYHILKAIAEKKNVDIGNRHIDIRNNINPRNKNRVLHIKKDVFEAYDILFTYSWTSRYDGFTDMDTFQVIKKSDYQDALKRYIYIRQYAISLDVRLDD